MTYNGKHFWNAAVVLSQSAEAIHASTNDLFPYEGNPLEMTLFVSCYNEEAFIADTLAVIVQAMQRVGKTYEIIVIDDGSSDQSVVVIKQFIAAHPEVNLMLRVNNKNKGLAQNYIDAAFIGRGKYYRLICGDNSEPLETLVDVLNMAGKADIIVPYYISAQGKSVFRQTVSRLYTWLMNCISGYRLPYYNGLQVHLRHNVMRWHPNTRGFGFQAGLICLLLDMGFTYKQIPCVTIERRGKSGNAITPKNMRSVIHVMGSILLRRLAR